MEVVEPTPRRRNASNVAFSLLAWAVPLALAFIATPILIKNLGLSSYGVYTLVLAVIGFGFTTGIGRVNAKYIPEFRSTGQNESLSKYLNFTFLLTLVGSILQGTLLAILTPYLVTDVFNISDGTESTVTTALLITCVIGPVMMIGQFFQSSLQGLHQFRSLSIITNVAAAALNVGAIGLAIGGYGVVPIICWNLVITIVSVLAYYLAARNSLPEFTVRINFDREIAGTVSKYAASIVIYQIMASVLYIFERGYVVRNFGAEALTYYVVPLMLGIYLHALLFNFAQAAIPVINEKLTSRPDLAAYYQNLTRTVLAIAGLIAGGYICYGSLFLKLWLGERFAEVSYGLLIIHGSAFALIVVSLVSWILIEAMRAPALNAISSIASTIVAIVVVVVLGKSLELQGIAYGRLLGAVVVLPIIWYAEFRFFGQIFWKFWLHAFASIAIAISAMLLASRGTLLYGTDNWLKFIANASFGVLLYTAVLLAVRFVPMRTFSSVLRRT